jgi:hypothetical protein
MFLFQKSEDLGNFGIDGLGSCRRHPTVHNDTLLVNEEFLEIPLSHLRSEFRNTERL